MKKVLIGLGVVVAGIAVYGQLIAKGSLVESQHAGSPTENPIPVKVVAKRAADQQKAAIAQGAAADKQILFGDFHVHTTFSKDAFSWGLPLMQGEGVHPVADACDFARYCSSLDFWSINDHAQNLTQRMWSETKDSIRECNAVADPANPDVVAFLGYEWTQIGERPETHYGHKNVFFKNIEEDKVPSRPIAADNPRVGFKLIKTNFVSRVVPSLLDSEYSEVYQTYNRHITEMESFPECPQDVDTKDLPTNCRESVKTPDELFARLDAWGYENMVIPHGNSWGFYTPPGSSWDKQLKGRGPEKEQIVEIYSGHGNSEEYRPWRAVAYNDDGTAYCPSPTKEYLPNCWRAGQIIQERCLAAGESAKACGERAITARDNYMADWFFGRESVPGTTLEDWLDAGQCKDCFQETFAHRPMTSTQYALAIRNFDDPENPKRFRFGFISSSDNHRARPGTGYKEVERIANTEMGGARDEKWYNLAMGKPKEPVPYSIPFVADDKNARELLQGAGLRMERAANFLVTGGLIAVHAETRNRDGIWNALNRKEVYGTSGPRILMWFDLLNSPDAPEGTAVPMGAETVMSDNPRFRVRAIGSFKQKPGCPEFSVNALTPERLQNVCRGECYNPSSERKLISRIEIIRVRPQISPDESVDGLIEDVWKSFDCPTEQNGCSVGFEDPTFAEGGRDAVYYARAIEEPTPHINGEAPLCEYDENGQCKNPKPCYAGYQTAFEDNCLAEDEARAWSSPIFVDFKKAIQKNVALNN